jgi:hypothetical protein
VEMDELDASSSLRLPRRRSPYLKQRHDVDCDATAAHEPGCYFIEMGSRRRNIDNTTERGIINGAAKSIGTKVSIQRDENQSQSSASLHETLSTMSSLSGDAAEAAAPRSTNGCGGDD